MDKIITSVDGSIEEQTKSLKDFLGLSPEQTFQDLNVEEFRENE